MLLSYDVEHEEQEERWHIIGQSQKFRTLFVVFCERVQKDGVTVYRIISARKAELSEAQEYENGH